MPGKSDPKQLTVIYVKSTEATVEKGEFVQKLIKNSYENVIVFGNLNEFLQTAAGNDWEKRISTGVSI